MTHSPEDTQSPRRPRPWLAPAIACGLAALFLLFLMIPGILRYQAAPDSTGLVALEDSNSSLQQEIDRFASIDRAALCIYDGGLYPQDAVNNGAAPDSSAKLDLLPPDATRLSPDAASLPASSAEPFEGSVDQLLRGATVMVLLISGDSIVSGSGFFVSPTQIVTNAHVVDGASEVIVTNDLIGDPITARVVAQTPVDLMAPMPQPDFALLEISQAEDSAIPLGLADAVRTQAVFASGYPGFFVQEEIAAYVDALSRNAPATPPSGIVTNGIVTTIQTTQRGDGSLEYIPHTARLSPGNSGGPLIDTCGRVVGINTFVTQSDDNNLILHGDYALGSGSLARFLRANGITAETFTTACAGAARDAAYPLEADD